MKKPNGYWKDFKKVSEFLLPKCQKLGRMLTRRELRSYIGISDAVSMHGGTKKVSEVLGVPTSTQYKTLSGNIVKSICEVIVDNFLYLNHIKFEYEGKIVNDQNYLFDFRINNVFVEVWGYVGESYKIKRKVKENIYKKNALTLISLELELFKNNKLNRINDELASLMRKHGIKKYDFYNEDLSRLCHFESYNKNKIIMEIKEECIRRKFKIFPTRNWWFKSKFRKKIKFLEGKVKMYELANMCGLKSNEKPKKYWKNFENVEKELLPICDSIGGFPTQKQLSILKREDLNNAMKRYHGGSSKVRKILGYQ